MATKQHELLAITNTLKGQKNKVIADQRALFEKKAHHFQEKKTLVTPLAEGEPQSIEAVSDLQTTVPKELAWAAEHIAKAWDASMGVEVANSIAKADIVLEDGTVLAKSIPATALLELEKFIVEVQNLAQVIPTLDPTRGFTLDSSRPDVYVAREVVKTRTRKGKRVITLAPATDKHPAQTQLVEEDLPVATLREQEWSSMITPGRKAEILSKVDELLRAVKRARSRANDTEVPTYDKISTRLLSFVFGEPKK